MASGGDLAVLRTAKIALQEDLITQEDFDVVKLAFLKAQQIKAGLDAGFIREEDYQQARDSFLHSLDFRVGMPNPSPSTTAPASPSRLSIPQQQPSYQQAPQQYQPTPAPAPSSGLRKSGTIANAGGSATMPRSGGGAAPSNGTAASASREQLPSMLQTMAGNATMPRGSSGGGGTVPLPADLPFIGTRPAANSGKKGLSGISVADNCVSVFNHIKTRSTYKWVIYKVDDSGLEVVVEQVGAPDSSYGDFISALPANQCRYAVYDYAYRNNDTQQTINKLVFLHWAPDSSAIKAKMMYASTKDFLKNLLDGIGAELQATDTNELQEHEMRDRVHGAMTRK